MRDASVKKGPVDFIGLGAARSGSSWIANVLRAHPEICLSEPKEVRYFNRYLVPVGNDKGKLNRNYDESIEWYTRHFSHARKGQVKGEITPVYLFDEAAPFSIKKHFPDVKLIVCLRNPVKRAYSSYRLHRGLSIIDDIPFEQAVEQEAVYVDMGLYAKQLKRYLEYFNREQLLVILFEDLIRQPDTVFRRIFEFLNVSDVEDIDFSGRGTNESSAMRSRGFHKAAFKFTLAMTNARLGFTIDWLRRLGVHSFVNRMNSSPSTCAPMKDGTVIELMSSFRDDIRELEELLELDLSQWTATCD
jgi:hypothetical protein